MASSIVSERLLLRGLDPDDARHILGLNADAAVLEHVHDAPFADIDAARSWILNIDAELPLGIGRWSITGQDGTWIGRCSLRRQPDGDVLVGYRLLREHWGQGFASEVVGALLHHAFQVHHVPFVLAVIAPENKASRRVAEKNGGALLPPGSDGRYADARVYRFDRPQSG